MGEVPPELNFDDMDSLPEVTTPEEVADPLYCAECEKTFKNAHGKAIHDSRIHGIKKETADKSPRGHSSGRATNREKQLTEFFVMVGIAVSMYNGNDGVVIGMHAERMGQAWSHLAASNKVVARYIDGLMTASSWAEVMAATLPVIVAIMANHGAVPPQMASMFPPPSPDVMHHNAETDDNDS